ncbi:hypothetical protein SAMN00790413_06267 [Deinococcus hopiensis KR-140]|uniref:Uncharacterized protein n=1 Tax=Deinococcus hopiensis KR-140 TaxID=695939 RepID=A0A1W1VUI5_9DEIO|nr:hypothetical protein SAMN00790413_06267 [Deinococcus hopiensis KR-140]
MNRTLPRGQPNLFPNLLEVDRPRVQGTLSQRLCCLHRVGGA